MNEWFDLVPVKAEGEELLGLGPIATVEYDELHWAEIDYHYEQWYEACLECGIEPTLEQLRRAEIRFCWWSD